MQVWKRFFLKWGRQYPAILKLGEDSRYALYFAVLDLPPCVRLMTWATNWVERLKRDYKRVLKMLGGLPNENAVIAIFASLDNIARETGARFILDGRNVQSECVMPASWFDNMKSGINLINIHDRFGTLPLKRYPVTKFSSRRKKSKLLQSIPLLQSIDYIKSQAKREIQEELGWRDYGGKHYESVFTRFYQGYILPEKLGVDKRKAHLSNLIFSGQMTREEALEALRSPIYPKEQLERDFPFLLKKLGFDEKQFYAYIDAPRTEHRDYGMTRSIWKDLPIARKVAALLNSIR
jgi:hypothetical protein